jgi:hypothetical protein
MGIKAKLERLEERVALSTPGEGTLRVYIQPVPGGEKELYREQKHDRDQDVIADSKETAEQFLLLIEGGINPNL